MNEPCDDLVVVRNGTTLPWPEVPTSTVAELQAAIVQALADGLRLCAWFALQRAGEGAPRLCAVLADDSAHRLHLGVSDPVATTFPALTATCPQAHRFEREIHEQFGLVPAGHPWLEPLRRERRHDGSATPPPALDTWRMHPVRGAHEVAVGPVHAGVIEPGHFRFQCDGEHVFQLEIGLGYQHRGIEATLRGGPQRASIHRIETLAGDTSVGHATAWCRVLEALQGLVPGAHDRAVRAIALELERLANHTGDLGALAGDVGYLPTAAFCGRIRGDFLNLTALLCGNRFGRGLVRPGRVRFRLDRTQAATLRERLRLAARDVRRAVDLLWVTPSVMARFEDTGTVGLAEAIQLGLVGVAARASGRWLDVRHDHPDPIYEEHPVPIAAMTTGDVHARAFVRWREIETSLALLESLLAALPDPDVAAGASPPPALSANHLAVALVEGWRGELCHVASTGPDGRFDRYKVVDASFHNWQGLAAALRGQEISDFPLCNKSFNLSYCGHDL